MKYYFPCKPNTLSLSSTLFDDLDRDTGWIAETKKNGWRCLVYREKDNVVLYTRHNTLINEPLPEIRQALLKLPPETILDGELLFTKRIKGHPDGLYLFDILMYKGKLLVDLPLASRRIILEEVTRGIALGPVAPSCLIKQSVIANIVLADQIRVGKRLWYYHCLENPDCEGIVLKKLDSKYPVSVKGCLQNPFWMKVKRVENHVAVGGKTNGKN